MSDNNFEIKCRRCGCDVVHHCVYHDEYEDHPDEPLIDLMAFNVAPPDLEAFKASPYYSADRKDESLPFFSEAFLYNLLGKEDGRTVLYSMRQALRHLGVDVRMLERLADRRTPCPHCNGNGRVIRPNPNWDYELYNEMKCRYEDKQISRAELTQYKRNLAFPCEYCEGGARFKRYLAKEQEEEAKS